MKKLLSVLLLLMAPLAWSAGLTVGNLKLDQIWARSAPLSGGNAAAYLSVANSGQQDDTLLSVATPIAHQAQLHNMSMEGGIMRMREMADGISLRPGETVRLAPGGMHIMLLGIKQPLKKGDHFPLTLHFEHAGTVNVDVPVLDQPPQAMPNMDNMKMN